MSALDRSQLLEMYRYLVAGRTMALSFGNTRKDWHSVEGEEAVVVGAFFGLRDSDVAAPHYRGCELVSYMRGEPLRSIYAGILGKATGKSHGRHKNEFCGPFEKNIIGLYSGVLGPNICYGAGAALALKLRKKDDIAVVSFGDGTANRGEFHETMRTAAMLDLPVVFVCQNNLYAISMPARRAFNGAKLTDLAAGYGVSAYDVDGMDVLAVNEAMREGVARARAGKGPSFVEARTCRFSGHWVSDRESYRPPEEACGMRDRCPVEVMRQHLIAHELATATELDEVKVAMNRAVAEAGQLAKGDPLPSLQHLGIDEVYARESA